MCQSVVKHKHWHHLLSGGAITSDSDTRIDPMVKIDVTSSINLGDQMASDCSMKSSPSHDQECTTNMVLVMYYIAS